MKRFQDISIKYKMALVTLIVAIIPLILFATTITYMYGQAIVSRSNKHIEENIRIMTDRIDTVFNDGELCSNYLTLSISDIMNDSSKKPVNLDSSIYRELNQSILIFKGIDSLVYLSVEGKYYTTNVNLLDSQEVIENSKYMEILPERNGKTVLFDMTDDCMFTDPSEPVVTMGKRVINIVSGKTMGYLFVNLDMDYLKKYIENEISYYLLYDGSGQCATGDQGEPFVDDATIQKKIYEDATIQSMKYSGSTYLIARDAISKDGWTVIGVTNLNEFNVSGEELLSILLITGIVIVLLLVVAIIVASSTITKPLMKLKSGAERIADGDLYVCFNFKSTDEIGLLGTIFNYMTKQIRGLIERVDAEARKKREYELALVQEQVKPHFLYNTLDIIIMLIDMNKEKEAKRVTKKLASYYKNSLSGSDEIVTVERELQIVQDYLDLQMMRYGDQFTYTFETEETTLQCSIPKMTLQPLVENAIYHGLKYKDEWGNISISTKRCNSDVLVLVEDNGIGMSEEELDRIKKLEEQPKEHFGVYSVSHRLQLYYGERYGIEITSIKGEGTKVTVRIPVR